MVETYFVGVAVITMIVLRSKTITAIFFRNWMLAFPALALWPLVVLGLAVKLIIYPIEIHRVSK